MRLVGESGLWTTGAAPEPGPLAVVLEVSGAVLSWTVDGDTADPPVITFTDHHRADWLWRAFGESGHVELVDALQHRDLDRPVEIAGLTVLPGATDMLRRLAFGHWLRRWWPASTRDGIAALEPAVLDAELALLTVAAEDFFTDDTLDSDVAGLLAPRIADLNAVGMHGDPRTAELLRECRELAGEIGLDWPAAAVVAPRRDDYALAAGAGAGTAEAGRIAGGVATVDWSAVPPGVFDAAEGTIEWSVTGAGPDVTAAVRVEVSGPDSPSGIEVELRGSGCDGSGVLDATGSAVLVLRDPDGQPLTETRAWNLDWSHATARVGAKGTGGSAADRDRVRAFARARLAAVSDSRLAAVPPGGFLAEILAAESDY